MKKTITKIISLTFSCILVVNAYAPISYAQTEPEKACQEEKDAFTESLQLTNWNEAEVKNQDALTQSY